MCVKFPLTQTGALREQADSQQNHLVGRRKHISLLLIAWLIKQHLVLFIVLLGDYAVYFHASKQTHL